MKIGETEAIKSEHRALVFRMNRKTAARVMRYLKEHSGAPEAVFAVDLDTHELIVQAKNAAEDDILLLPGEEDIFDVEETEMEVRVSEDNEEEK